MAEPLPEPEKALGSIFDIGTTRLRNVYQELMASGEDSVEDAGFRVFRLDTSNVRVWDPDHYNLERTILDSVDHIKPERNSEDLLYELLLKLGIEITLPIETREIAGKSVRSTSGGTLITCLDESITAEEVEQLAQGISDWRDEMAPNSEGSVIFRDSAFADDVVKANLTAILEQRGLGNVRSL